MISTDKIATTVAGKDLIILLCSCIYIYDGMNIKNIKQCEPQSTYVCMIIGHSHLMERTHLQNKDNLIYQHRRKEFLSNQIKSEV